MTFTLLHPSRGRARQARQTFDLWLKKSSGKFPIEYILSVDEDDPQAEMYALCQPSSGIPIHFESSVMVANDNTCVVEATNKAAELATGNILIYLSDDFQCPDEWDCLIMNEVHRQHLENEWLLKVDDCLQRFEVDVLTIPIMSIDLYKKLGYFWHPEYKSMFVDQDLFHTCKNNNWLFYAPHIKFPHLHYSNSKAPMDDTYKKSSLHWDSGKKLYHQRKAIQFPL